MNRKLLVVLLIGIFSGYTSYAQQEQRCNSVEYLEYLKATKPGYVALMEQADAQLQEYISTHKNNQSRTIITIPVVVHLLYHTDSLNQQLSNWQIASQIDALNEDYRRFNADRYKTPSQFDSIGADCEIEFCLAKRDPNGNATNGIRRIVTDTSVFHSFSDPKFSATGGDDAWPFADYLNIWVCPLVFPLLGYSTFPSNSMTIDDGVVIHYKAFGRINCFSKRYNVGRTATHEIGHWFNLSHIDGDDNGGCNFDDGIDDTPLEDIHRFGCPEFPSPSCSNVSDIFMDYMDYTNDSCMNLFTFGQKTKMVSAFNLFRSSILSSQGCTPLPAQYAWDIGVSKILNPDEFIYGDSVTPVVTIHNFGIQPISTASIYYTKNWKSAVNVFNWHGLVNPDESVEVTLPKIIDSTWFNLFCAWTKYPNGMQDADTSNDFKTRSYIVSLKFPPIADAVNVYPNPTSGVVTIDFGEIIDLKGTITVFNVLGQQEHVRMDQLSLSKFQIDLGNFPSGMYFLDLRVNDNKVVKKVIVQHEL